MKLVILAGGMGQRLSRRTNDMPKPMIPIGDKPIIWHIMKYYSHYGINEFVICLGYKAECIRNYFVNYKVLNSDVTVDYGLNKLDFHGEFGESQWKVTLADTGFNSLKGARIKKIEKYLDDDINLLTYSDGLGDIDIGKLLEFHKRKNKTVTITAVTPPGRFGEINEENGIVKSFAEKGKTSDRYINGGFMVFNRGLLDYLSEDENCDLEKGTLELLSEKGEVAAYLHNGNWVCMDNEADAIDLNDMYHNGKAFWKKW
jgi:glucose-1-phosphate cytidylyltransferase